MYYKKGGPQQTKENYADSPPAKSNSKSTSPLMIVIYVILIIFLAFCIYCLWEWYGEFNNPRR
jgi:hypothetical protein